MIIKKLSKSEVEEGLTLELVNLIDLKKKCSPVQIQAGDEPVNLLVCSSGYNVIIDGKVLRDASNKPLVIAEREVQIARARYLKNYGAKEKEERVNELVESWRSKVREILDKTKLRIDGLKKSLAGEGLHGALLEMGGDSMKENLQAELSKLEPAYNQAEEMYSEGRLPELLDALNIKKLNPLMLRAEYDNPEDMRVLKAVFHREALDKWNGDTLKAYAMIEIEKEYKM